MQCESNSKGDDDETEPHLRTSFQNMVKKVSYFVNPCMLELEIIGLEL